MIRRAAIFLTLFISLLAGVLPAAAAMGGRNVDQFNRQLHPDERRKIAEAAAAFAEEHGISEAEAIALLQRLAGYIMDPRYAQSVDQSGLVVEAALDAAARDYLRNQLGIGVNSKAEYENWHYGWSEDEIKQQFTRMDSPWSFFTEDSPYQQVFVNIRQDDFITKGIINDQINRSIYEYNKRNSLIQYPEDPAIHDLTLDIFDAWTLAQTGRGVWEFGAWSVSTLTKKGVVSAANKALVIIGENMGRVNSYAGKVGGETIDGWLAGRKWTPQLNDDFISTIKAQGRQIEDIGPDFTRRLDYKIDPSLPNARQPSPIYGGERQQLLDYGNYQQLYQRSGKYQGGVPGFDP